MSIPDVDATRIEQALHDFDAQKRGQEWANWESDSRFAFAILWHGRRYPVKEIVRMATGVTDFITTQARSYLGQRSFQIVRLDSEPGLGDDICTAISRSFALRGLQFTNWQIATYFTALQTKGFVILSGLSGTGKTKLAQHFAKLMHSDGEEAENYLFLPVRPDWRDGKPLLGYYNPLTERYETSELLRFILDARQEQTAPRLANLPTWLSKMYETERVQEWLTNYHRIFERLKGVSAVEMSSDDLHLLWQEVHNGIASVGRARPLKVNEDQLREATAIVQDTSRTIGRRLIDAIQYLREIPGNVTPWARTLRAVAAFDPVSTVANHHNLRDLLDMLGYERSFRLRRLVDSDDATAIEHAFAFLQKQVERYTSTVDPLLHAITPWLIWEYLSGQVEPLSHGTPSSSPFFILLDEMNLSRVEYYFADFLSVLEGGRSEDGFTRETIKLHHFPVNATDKEGHPKPLDSDGRYVPPELRLPPNLYFVGTVNVDETTHAFSPKVLDRAFTIEITEVDLERYPAEIDVETDGEESVALTERLLPIFTRDGRFGIVDKSEIRDFVAAHPEYRAHLDRLKNLLQPYDLHFAYRVFDEIISFCANARANGLWTDLGGLETAFDCAVLMKVLPKFHGPRSKLDRPLRDVLAWTFSPDSPGHAIEQVKKLTKDADTCLKLRRQLDTHVPGQDSPAFRYPHTARKVVRMLQALHAIGFASFA